MDELERVLASPDFQEHLSQVSAASTPEPPALFCRVTDEGWRYRPQDEPEPLYVMPDWGAQRDDNWRWHHQSLSLTGVYVRLHEERGDPRALPMLQAVIEDWHARASDPVFTWGDHTTALRLKRLVRLFGRLFKDFEPRFRVALARMIGEHAHRLLTDVARSHHNHALDQIYALTLAKRYLPFLDIPEDVLAARLEVERGHLLSREGVVTENSPGYQSWIPARIAECQRLLTGATDTALLAQSDEFTAWIARPDGTWPEFGDTAPGKPIEPAPPPRTGLRVFPHAGYAAFRDARTWLVAKCGFLSHAHRHHDDGSFLLAVDGHDVFVEAGLYGYAPGWERTYARSPEAHNLSVRVGANTIRSTTSRRWQRHRQRWGMSATDGGLLARSYMYDDAMYVREFRCADGRIAIEDRFDVPGRIRTRFHVPEGVPIQVLDGCVRVGPVTLAHDLGRPDIVAGHRTVAYLAYVPAQVIEFEWPDGRLSARFMIELSPASAQP